MSVAAGSHRFVTVPTVNPRKRRRKTTKSIRVGSRKYGAQEQGSRRRPY